MSRCPLEGHTLIDPTFCPVCVIRIERNPHGVIERAHRRNPHTGALQVVFQRRPNSATALELDGPRRAELHARPSRYTHVSALDGWTIGGESQAHTKDEAVL